VSWKVYTPSNVGLVGTKYASLTQYVSWNPTLYNPTANPEAMFYSDAVLPYFTAFRDPLSTLYDKAFNPTFPGDFAADVAAGKLPSVSWLIPPAGFDDHPISPVVNGMYFGSLVLDALLANPAVWSKTALFLMFDEHGGFFDHVPPPVAPPGTPGEYLTATPPKIGDPTPALSGFEGPLGLGVRVPMLVISPFSKGGRIVSDVLDHTSQLKLISQRFGVAVPNVSDWRKATVGDLTTTLFQGRTDASTPTLPVPTPYWPASGPCSGTDQATPGLVGGAGPTLPATQ